MEHRIEPEESWLLAPWHRKKEYEKAVLAGMLVICVRQTVEAFERGHLSDWLFVPGFWLILVWAYFSRSGSHEIIVATELKLNGPHSIQAEGRSPALK